MKFLGKNWVNSQYGKINFKKHQYIVTYLASIEDKIKIVGFLF